MRGASGDLLDAFFERQEIDLDALIEVISTKYNPIYDTKGLENQTYMRFFSRFKNLPPFTDEEKKEEPVI